MIKNLMLLLLVFIFILPSAFAQNYEIIPDKGIEELVTLGESRDNVIETLGKPDMRFSLGQFFTSSNYDWAVYFYNEYSISLVFNEKEEVIYIGTGSEKYSTSDNITVGATFDKVVDTYGGDYVTEEDPAYDYIVDYGKMGMDFKFIDEKVAEIGISHKTVFTSSNSVTTSGTYIIKPFRGIEGVIYLGNTKDQVWNVWGEPSMIESMAQYFGPDAEEWRGYFFKNYNIYLLFNEEDKITAIGAISSAYTTEKGIKTGDSVETLVSTYGSNYSQKPGGKDADYKINYSSMGLEFNIKNGKIAGIVIWAESIFSY